MTSSATSSVRWWPLLLIAAGLLAYANALNVPFLFDDESSILYNPHLLRLWPLTESLQAPTDTTAAGRPVVCFSLALNYALGGFAPGGWHALNVVIHVSAAWALFALLRRTLALPRLPGPIREAADGLAFAVALLWLLHPLHTESVTYVIQRAESLAAAFGILTLAAVARAADAARPGRWEAVAVFCCALAMGSKETAVSLPLLVLLYDRCTRAESFAAALRARPRLYAGLAATWLLLAALVAGAPRSGSAGFGFAHCTPWEYALTQCDVLLHYARLAIWPHPLVFDYGWPISRSWTDALPSGPIVLAVLALTTWAAVRRPLLGFPGVVCLLWLAPTSSFLPIITEPAAEHRMTLPLAPLVTLAVLAAHALMLRLQQRGILSEPAGCRVRRFALIAAALVLGTLTHLRNRDYQDALTLWSVTVEQRPDNARAHDNLGVAWQRAGHLPEAIAEYRLAVRLDAALAQPHINLGTALAQTGDMEEARRELELGVELAPQMADGWYNLGTLLGPVDPARAVECLTRAVQLAPARAEAHLNLGIALSILHRDAEAGAAFEQALRRAPALPAAHYGWAAVYARQGRPAEAEQHYRAALVPWPGRGAAAADLAWLLATCPDPDRRRPEEAVRWAEVALHSGDPDDSRRLDVFAAACAAAGRFPDAVAAAQRALAAAERVGPPAAVAPLRARLALYEQRRPFVDAR